MFLKHGYMLRDGKLYARTYLDNPFATRILRVDWDNLGAHDDNPTVYVGQHGELRKLGSAEYIDNPEPAWLQLLHGSNVGNYLPKHCVRREIGRLQNGYAYLNQHNTRENRLRLRLEQLPQSIIHTIWWRTPYLQQVKRKLLNRDLQ